MNRKYCFIYTAIGWIHFDLNGLLYNSLYAVYRKNFYKNI